MWLTIGAIPVGNLRSMGHLAPYFYLHWFHKFYLDVSSLIATTSAFVEKKNSKMRHLKKFVKPMKVNSTCIGFTNFL